MLATQFVCPKCRATLKTANPLPPGKQIKCPKCTTVFAVPKAGTIAPAKPQVPAQRTVPQATSKPAATSGNGKAAAAGNGKPVVGKKTKPKGKPDFKKKKNTGMNPAVLWGVIGGVLLIGGGGAAVAFAIMSGSGKKDEPVAAATDTKAPAPANPVPANPMPANPANMQQMMAAAQAAGKRPPTSAGNPAVAFTGPAGQTPLPGQRPIPGTQPQFSGAPDISKLKLAELSLGNIAGKPALELEALRYIPADADLVMGFHLAEVTNNPTLMGLVQFILGTNPLTAQAGLNLQDADHIVASVHGDLLAGAAGPVNPQNLPKQVYVVKMKAPIDRVKILQATKAGQPQQQGDKQFYKLPAQFGQPTFLYMPTDQILVLGNIPDDKAKSIVAMKGDQPSLPAEVTKSLQTIDKAHVWVTLPITEAQKLTVQALMKQATQVQGVPNQAPQVQGAPNPAAALQQLPPELKPIMDLGPKINAAALGVLLQDKQLQFSLAASFPDDATANQVATGMQTYWSKQGKMSIAASAFMLPSSGHPFLTEVTKSMQFKGSGSTATMSLQASYKSIEGVIKAANELAAKMMQQQGVPQQGVPQGLPQQRFAQPGFPQPGQPGFPPQGFPTPGAPASAITRPGTPPPPATFPLPGAPGALPGKSPVAMPDKPPKPPANPVLGLEVGNIAPEITGKDIDGKHFKLSDYKGKLVMLDFWGHW